MPFKIARNHGGQFPVTSLGNFNGLAATLQKDLQEFRFARCNGIRSVASFVKDKDTHGHTQFSQGVSDLLLLFDGPSRHPIVFYSTEALVIPEFYLIDKIIAGAVAEHAIVNAIVKIKGLPGRDRPRRSLFLRRGGGSCPGR